MREGHLSKNCCHQLTKGRYYAKNPAVRLIHYKNNMTKFDFQNRKAVGQAFQLRPIIRGQKKIELFFRVQIQIRIGIWLPKAQIFAVIFYYQNNCMNYPGISNQSIMKRELDAAEIVASLWKCRGVHRRMDRQTWKLKY